MSESEERLAAIRERLNYGQPISVEDALFLARAVDRWQATARMWLQQVEQLKDRLREIEWANRSDDGRGYCPACEKAEDAVGGHDPECWLWLTIRTA